MSGRGHHILSINQYTEILTLLLLKDPTWCHQWDTESNDKEVAQPEPPINQSAKQLEYLYYVAHCSNLSIKHIALVIRTGR